MNENEWVHNKCSRLQRLIANPGWSAHPFDGRPQNEFQVGLDIMDVIAFCWRPDLL